MKTTNKGGLYVTFDIGSVSVKAVSLEVTEKSKRLVTVVEEKFNTPIIGIEEEKDKDIIVTALKNVVQKLKISKNAKISACFYNREMQIKIIDLPQQIQSAQLEQTISWEAKKLISPSFKDAPYTYAYKIVKNNPYSIALAAIPVSILNKYIDLFKKANIKLSGIYPEVFSGIALRPMADIAGLPAVSLVNVGYSGTHLQIFSTGNLKFYRYIPSGTSELSEIPNPNELEVFAQKIRFSFDYFRAVTKLTQIDLLCFMGGGAAIEGLLSYQQAYFAPTKISPLDISSGIDIANAFTGSEETAEDKQKKLLAFDPAIGISLAASEEEAIKMNFLAQVLLKERAERNNKLLGIIPVIVSLAIIIGVFAFIMPKSNELTKEINNSENNIAKLNQEIENLNIEIQNNKIYNKILLQPKYERVLGDSIKQLQNEFHYRPIYHVKRIAKKNNGIRLQEILIKNEDEAKLINLLPIDNITSEDEKKENETSNDNKEKITIKPTKIINNDISNDILDIGLDSLEESNEDTEQRETANIEEEQVEIQDIKQENISETKNETNTINKNTNKFLSSMAQDEFDEQTLKVCFEGKTIIIKGIADNLKSLGKYVNSLITERNVITNIYDNTKNSQEICLTRIKSIVSRQIDGGIEFLLKGDLP